MMENMLLDGQPAMTILGKILARVLLLVDSIMEFWVTVTVVDISNSEAATCARPYQIVAETTERGQVFADSVARTVEALFAVLPQFLYGFMESRATIEVF